MSVISSKYRFSNGQPLHDILSGLRDTMESNSSQDLQNDKKKLMDALSSFNGGFEMLIFQLCNCLYNKIDVKDVYDNNTFEQLLTGTTDKSDTVDITIQCKDGKTTNYEIVDNVRTDANVYEITGNSCLPCKESLKYAGKNVDGKASFSDIKYDDSKMLMCEK
jgi:hypothetical protein